MSRPYAHRYAGLRPEQCDREALLLMQEAVNRTRKWEDVAERLMELRRLKSYAPEPVVAPRQELARLSE